VRTELVRSQNSRSWVKTATYDPAALNGEGGWTVEGSSMVLNREQFHGNYVILRKEKHG
jgi:hypothetical protein